MRRCGCKSKRTRRRVRRPRVLKAGSTTFYALSDGKKRIYTNRDGVQGYGVNRIPNPRTVSLVNVLVNGVLQPKSLYEIKSGKLRLLSDDVPAEGVPIIVQSISIFA
jgi:hypothetical protein